MQPHISIQPLKSYPEPVPIHPKTELRASGGLSKKSSQPQKKAEVPAGGRFFFAKEAGFQDLRPAPAAAEEPWEPNFPETPRQ
jgi:hypothetical protein